jgi:hypothetical protein
MKSVALQTLAESKVFSGIKAKSRRAVIVTLAMTLKYNYGLLEPNRVKGWVRELNLGKYAQKEAIGLCDFLLGEANRKRLPSTLTDGDLVSIAQYWGSKYTAAIDELIRRRGAEEEEVLSSEVVDQTEDLLNELSEMRADQRSDERAYTELEAQHHKLLLSYGDMKESMLKLRAKERTIKHIVQTVYKKLNEAKEVSLQEFGLGEINNR